MNKNEDLKRWFKQTFCRHEWQSVGELGRFTVREDGIPIECFTDTKECCRCGKQKTNCYRAVSKTI